MTNTLQILKATYALKKRVLQADTGDDDGHPFIPSD